MAIVKKVSLQAVPHVNPIFLINSPDAKES